jgi:VCBS repeat-containing protein
VQDGWTYIKVADPGAGLKLTRVMRSDGTDVPVGDMVWRTDRTFRPGEPGATYENILHILDRDSTGSYTLTYAVDDRIAPSVLAVEQPPSVVVAPVTQIDVTFTEPMDLSTFTVADLVLSRNGVALDLTGATITQISGSLYRIGNLGALTTPDGNYTLTVDSRTMQDLGGNAGTNARSVSWAMSAVSVVVASIEAVVPDPRNIAVGGLEVEFSRALDPASFGADDIGLTRDGAPIALDSRVVVTQLTGTRFRINGLGTLTDVAGAYALTVFGAGVNQAGGGAGTGQLTETWVTDTTAPAVVAVEEVATNPRNTVLLSLDVDFSEAIDPASFTAADITLTRNGGANLIVPTDIVLTQVSETRWKIAGFNWVSGLVGDYVLTVNGAGLLDLAGNAGTGSASSSWTMDTGAPAAASNLRITPDTGVASDDELTNTQTFSILGDLAEPGLTVRFYDLTTSTDLGVATVTGTSFEGAIVLASPGKHDIRVRTVDDAGNTEDVVLTVFVDVSAPAVTAIQAVAPDPRTTPVFTLDVTLSETIDLATFDFNDIVLTRDGTALDVSSLTIALVSGTTYRIGGLDALTGVAGDYALTVAGAGISDRAGNAGTGSRTAEWTRVASLPTGITGRVFEDFDANGVFGSSAFGTTDIGLEGWTVWIDADDDGVLDAGETSTTTAADGTYAFTALTAGTYVLRAELRTGWVSTGPAANRIEITLLAEQTITNANFARFELGAISGQKFNDLDGDGIQDAGEEGLAGVTLFVDRNGNNELDAGEISTVTDADGRYSFTGLTYGTVRIGEVATPGWARTTPPASMRVISGFDETGVAIGNVRTVSISGLKFEDLNGNGVRDAGEGGVAGWTIFIDANGDGVLQATETSVVTGADGTYSFTGLLPGTYIIAEVQREGWVQTTPTGSAAGSGIQVSLAGSDVELTMEGCSCGGTWSLPEGSDIVDLGAMSTRASRDLTGLTAALQDARFTGLTGAGTRTVLIDTGIDLDHPFFGPDSNGDGVADRIVYQWDFADNDNSAQDIAKGHGSHVASLIASQDSRYGGVAQGTDLIVLKVFSDSGRGTFANVEKALQWVIANAEAWNIGVINMSLGDNGNWTTAMPRYGLGDEFATLAAMNIITVAASGNFYNQYNSMGVAYPAADPAVIGVGAVWSADFGGPWTVATGATDYTTGADRIAAFTQRDDELLDILAPGARFNGANATGGVQTMQGTSQAAGFVSGAAALAQQLANQVLGRNLSTAEFAELLKRTGDMVVDGDDENDNVRNTGLSFPRIQFTRLFEEILTFTGLPGGGTGGGGGGTGGGTTRPQETAAPGVHTVTVTAGENRTDVSFGNFRLATIGGTVFEDLDSDGVRDAGESALSGRVVFLDDNGNGTRDDGEAFDTTDASGAFDLGERGPGEFRLMQELPAGSIATTPNPIVGSTTSGAALVLLVGSRPANLPPVAVDDRATLSATFGGTVDVLANDSDPDFDTLTLVSVPATSTLGAALSIVGGQVRYDASTVPALLALPAGSIVTDTFTYVVGDGNGGEDTGTVTLRMVGRNDPPRAVADSRTTNEDTRIAIAATANDTDPDTGDTLSVASIPPTSVLGAELYMRADGRIVYDPRDAATLQALAPGQSVTDRFVYTVRDAAGLTSRAVITVVVSGVNDAPTPMPDTAATDEDTVAIIPVVANDTDPDRGDRVTVDGVATTSALGARLRFTSRGEVIYDPRPSVALQALNEGETITDTFVYSVRDRHGGIATQTVEVVVTGRNDAPVARDNRAATNEDRVIAIDVLSNDNDRDAGTVLTALPDGAVSMLGAALSVDGTGRIVYDPTGAAALQALNGGEIVWDSFTYTVSDGAGGTATATVTVKVIGRKDRPVANPDTAATRASVPVDIAVLANDTDADAGTVLTVLSVQGISRLGATVTINPDGTVHYDPTSSATLGALADGSYRWDRFTYTVTDGTGRSATTDVKIRVRGEAIAMAPAEARAVKRAAPVLEEEDIVIDLAAEFAGFEAPVAATGVSSWQVGFVAEGAEGADPNRGIEVLIERVA